ncbi:hypothetical protein AB6D92_25435, partial [Vibrio splendidus]
DQIVGSGFSSTELRNKAHYKLTFALTGTWLGKVYTSNYPFNNAYSSLKEGHYYYVSSGSHAIAMPM